MSEHSYLPLMFKAEREKNPEAFIITDADITRNEQAQAKRRAENEKINPPTPVPARIEYNRLRQELYSLQQEVRNGEIKVNNEAGSVRHFQELVDTLLKKKKVAKEANELGNERMYEHQLVGAETELLDARDRLTQAQRWNNSAVRALKNFNKHERIAELKKQLDG